MTCSKPSCAVKDRIISVAEMLPRNVGAPDQISATVAATCGAPAEPARVLPFKLRP
jgi:hypothetical protein